MLVEAVQPTLLGVSAVIAAVGGVVSTIYAIRKGRREERDTAHEECRKRLAAARSESEELANALHSLRMARFDHSDGLEAQLARVDDILERWSHLE